MEIIIEYGVKVAATLVITLIGALGTWLTLTLNKKFKLGNLTIELQNINAAQQEVIALAQQTVGELQQTVVDDLKEASADGKLSDEEIAALSTKLYNKTVAKMSVAAYNLLTAAAVDVTALITGAAEDWISALKR